MFQVGMESARRSFGSELREMRLSRGLTQAHLSDVSGVSRRTLIRWEAGEVAPHRVELNHVLEVLEADGEEEQRLSALLFTRESTHLHLSPGACVACLRGRLGLTVEAMAKRLQTHGTTVRRWEKAASELAVDRVAQAAERLGLTQPEVEAVHHAIGHLVPRDKIATATDWTNFDLTGRKNLESTMHDVESFAGHALELAQRLVEAHRFSEARELSERILDKFAEGAPLPKVVVQRAHCIAARTYLQGGWRTAQRGLAIMLRIRKVAVGRAAMCEYEVSMSGCYRRHGLMGKALSWANRAMDTASTVGGDVLAGAKLCRADALLSSGLPQEALRELPTIEAPSASEMVKRMRLLREVLVALGREDEAAHWRTVALGLIDEHRLHGLFRLQGGW